MTNLEMAKQIIKLNFEDGNCGIFDCRNYVGDPMTNLYKDDEIQIDICYRYNYFEVFGLTAEEFTQLEKYYRMLEQKYS